MESKSSSDNIKTPLREVRLRVAFCFALMLLSSDSLNPVKIMSNVLNIPSGYFAWFFGMIFFGIICANANDLVYFMIKVFFHSILSIFFSSMEVLGKQNIPLHGPIIFTGNHMNQFVDGAIIIITIAHRVSFLVAEKSFNTTIIGNLTKAAGGIPVSRPQDNAVKGVGLVHLDGLKLVGKGTQFTQLTPGMKIRIGKSADSYKIKEILSDSELLFTEEYGEASPLHEKFGQGPDNLCGYDVLAIIDQSKMFDAVQAALAAGKCLGIFPEGGSHDNTDLLPLKVGVAAIALGVLEKYDISVPIVPVGLNYFRGHRFRGRVVVEFGEPILITKELMQSLQHLPPSEEAAVAEATAAGPAKVNPKRLAYQQLLKRVEDGMRSVIVTAPDYAELKLIHVTRRLYQRSSGQSTKDKQDLARRFATGFRLLREQFEASGLGIPEELLDLRARLERYQDLIEYWGLRDYQLQGTNSLEVPYSKMLYIFLHGAGVFILASIPSLILNAPVGIAAHYWSERQAKKDLQTSRVKVKARDVLLSKKIVFSLVAVPTLWISYAVLLMLFTSWQKRTILVLFLCCPVFSYLGVMAVEAGMMDIKHLRPAFLRLLPSFKQQVSELPRLRSSLQKEVRAMVKKYGPALGPVYFDRSYAWEASLKKAHRDLGSASRGSSQTKEITLETDGPLNESTSVSASLLKGKEGEEGQPIISVVELPEVSSPIQNYYNRKKLSSDGFSQSSETTENKKKV